MEEIAGPLMREARFWRTEITRSRCGKLAPSNDWNDCKIKRTSFARRVAPVSICLHIVFRCAERSKLRRRAGVFLVCFFAFNAPRRTAARRCYARVRKFIGALIDVLKAL